MSDLISRQNAIDVLELLADKMSDEGKIMMAQAVAVLKDLQSAEPERKGKWIDDGTELGCCCSECRVTLDDYFYGALYEVRLGKMPNFCPNCGTEMREEHEDIPMEYFENGGI